MFGRGWAGLRGDTDLVAAVRRGDDDAFAVLYERYNRQVAHYIYGMVRDHGRAEDVTQDVFISALRRMRQTEQPIIFKAWVYEIAKNACIDQFRRSQRRSEVCIEADEAMSAVAGLHRLSPQAQTPESAVEQKMSLDNLRGAFSGLSETHHQILVMRELDGLSYREIGERLDMSRAAVESTLFRARRRLTDEYEELVTGERCRAVRQIADGAAGGQLGARERRRMAVHMSHCQGCRRHARSVGLEIAPRLRAGVAALLPFPLPALLRRREITPPVNGSPTAGAAQWAAQLTSAADPAMSGWLRAAAAAATVAVAGIGAGHDMRHLASELIGGGHSTARVTHVARPVTSEAPIAPAVRVAPAHRVRPASHGAATVKRSTWHPSTPARPAAPAAPAAGIPAQHPAVKAVDVPDLQRVTSPRVSPVLDTGSVVRPTGPARAAVRMATHAVGTTVTAVRDDGRAAVQRVVTLVPGT